jgi:nicotinamide-nucleotide amidase
MSIEVVSIGNEVLAGVTVNTNATFISKELLKQGFLVSRHTVLSDEAQPLKAGLAEVLARSQIILCTGGLGPTCDDNTRQVAAELFGSEIRYNEAAEKKLAERFGTSNAAVHALRDQATLPEKAVLFPNPVGTAYGLLFTSGDKAMIFMPGVPVEMEAMFLEQVLPYLTETYRLSKRHYRVHFHLCQLKEMMVDPTLRQLRNLYPDVDDVGIYPSEGLLGVSLSVLAENQQQAARMLRSPMEFFQRQFAQHIYAAPDFNAPFEMSLSGRIEEAIQADLVSRKKTLAVAESCTGGAVAAKLVSLAGASNYFLGSVTAYCDQIKRTVLGVKQETLDGHGAVSEETVAEMALGVMQLMNTDYGIAVSGIAGPDGGTPEKPVGTVCLAICGRGYPMHTWTFRRRGNRPVIIGRPVNEALTSFWFHVCQKGSV